MRTPGTEAAPGRLVVRVPGSTSNLGPGFDALGMAVSRFLTVRYEPGPGGLRIHRRGTLEGLAIDPDDDLVVRNMGGTAALSGVLEMRSDIPVGRGLGSSAAAGVAGSLLRDLLAGVAPDRERAARMASASEGHPDNAVPSAMGGLVTAVLLPDGLAWARLPLSPELGWVYAAPAVQLSTREARAALPHGVEHAAAVRNAARLPLLLQALASGDGPSLTRWMEDELHVPYRLPLIPGGAAAMEEARTAGAWACTISGAGSGLLAACPRDRRQAVADAMAAAFAGFPDAGDPVAFALDVDFEGATWSR